MGPGPTRGPREEPSHICRHVRILLLQQAVEVDEAAHHRSVHRAANTRIRRSRRVGRAPVQSAVHPRP
eukprot:1128849-Prorocentrum_minimum.AAC.1